MGLRRIAVLLSEQEYTQVRNMAGMVPLSRWFKNLALGSGVMPHAEGPAGSVVQAVAGGAPSLPKETSVEVSKERNGEGGDHREVVLQPGGEVRTKGGRKSDAAGRARVSGKTVRGGESDGARCQHGRAVGEYCGFCFGPAKRVKG